jgi:hypothetical protein
MEFTAAESRSNGTNGSHHDNDGFYDDKTSLKFRGENMIVPRFTMRGRLLSASISLH